MVRSAGLNRRRDPSQQLNWNAFKGSASALLVALVVAGGAQQSMLAVSPSGIRLHEVSIKSGAHSCINAFVYVPKLSGNQKKFDVVVYNHGYGTTASGAFAHAHLVDQMRISRPGSLLIVPEWQKVPGSRNSDQGVFEKEGQFKALLHAAFDQVPSLKGGEISSITIVSHSAGYGPAETELYKNDLPPVRCIILLDALYDSCGFDPWLKANIKSLSSGEKRFYNIFNDTSEYSRAQAMRVGQFLRAEGLTSSCLLEDYNNGSALLGSSAFKEKSIIFKFSSYKNKKNTSPGKEDNAHDSIAACYVAPALSALPETAMVKEEKSNILMTAKIVQRFEIGDSNQPSDAWIAYHQLQSAGSASRDGALEMVASKNGAARIYGASLLLSIAPDKAKRWLESMKNDSSAITYAKGDALEPTTVGDLAQRLLAGENLIRDSDPRAIEMIRLARASLPAATKIPADMKISVKTTAREVIVTFGGPPPVGVRGVDYLAKVTIDSCSAKVVQVLFGP